MVTCRCHKLAAHAWAIAAVAIALLAPTPSGVAQTRWEFDKGGHIVPAVFMPKDSEVTIAREFGEWHADFYVSNKTGSTFCTAVFAKASHENIKTHFFLLKPYEQHVGVHHHRETRAVGDNRPWSADIRLVVVAATDGACRGDEESWRFPAGGEVWDARPGQSWQRGRGWE